MAVHSFRIFQRMMFGYMIFFLLQVPANNAFLTTPKNTLVTVGQEFLLNCTMDMSLNPVGQWQEYYSSVNAKRTLSTNHVPDKDHPKKNDIMIVGEYSLWYNSSGVTKDIGGTHRCQYLILGQSAYAEVFVVDSLPSCGSSPLAVVEGTSTPLTCTLGYKGNWLPNMTWSGPSGGLIASSLTGDGNGATLVSTITPMAADNGDTYTCTASFDGPPAGYTPTDFDAGTDTMDMTAPDFNEDCSVTLNVLYQPKNIQFNPTPQANNTFYLNVGETIVSTAEGNPTPQFYWEMVAPVGGQNFTIIEAPTAGNTLTITPDMIGNNEYDFTVWNTIQGTNITVTQTVVIIVSSPTTTQSTEGTTEGTETSTVSATIAPDGLPDTTLYAIIGGACGLAVVVIITVVAICVWNSKKKMKVKQIKIADTNKD